jgi:hypothetical protein
MSSRIYIIISDLVIGNDLIIRSTGSASVNRPIVEQEVAVQLGQQEVASYDK